MHLITIAASAVLLTLATTVAAQQAAVPVNGFCVQNASDKGYFFTVDNGEARLTGQLGVGEILCSRESDTLQNGFVSVFKTAETIEGCSRLVLAGTIEGLIRYADFDRCEWTSHSGG